MPSYSIHRNPRTLPWRGCRLLAGVINKIIPMFIFTGCLWLQSVRGTHRSLTAPESGSETRKLSELHRIVVYQNFTRANRVNPCSPKWCLLRSIAKHFIRPQSGPGRWLLASFFPHVCRLGRFPYLETNLGNNDDDAGDDNDPFWRKWFYYGLLRARPASIPLASHTWLLVVVVVSVDGRWYRSDSTDTMARA